LQKTLQEVSPEELQETTKETYTPFKEQYLNDHHDDKIGEFTLEIYIARLEYELKVIKEM
jgi:DNA polymerase III alpha subunit